MNNSLPGSLRGGEVLGIYTPLGMVAILLPGIHLPPTSRVHPVLPASVARSRTGVRDGLTALDGGVAERNISDEGVTAVQRLPFSLSRFTVGQFLTVLSDVPKNTVGREACCAYSRPLSTTRFTG